MAKKDEETIFEGEVKAAFRCKICQADFPCDGRGFVEMRDHATLAHQCVPGEACLGVVNVETDEVLWPGYSPTVLKKAREMGWAAPKGQKMELSSPGANSEADSSRAEVIPMDTARGKKTRGYEARSQMIVLAKNVVVDETVLLLFHQACAFFDYENTPQDLSRFVTESCVIAAGELGLDGAVLFSNLLEQTLTNAGGNDEWQ